MTKTFEMNGKAYRTDAETLKVLQDAVALYRETKDTSVITAIMSLGEMTGRITRS